MTVSIITSAQHLGGRPSMTPEIMLARAAMLYADDVELISLNAAWITYIIRLANLPPEMGIRWVLEQPIDEIEALFGPGWENHVQTIDAVLLVEDQAELEATLRQVFEREDIDLSSMYALRPMWIEGLSRQREIYQQRARELVDDSGYNALLDLEQQGLVRVSSPHLTMEQAARDEFDSYVAMLKRRLEDPTSRLLFDRVAGAFARSLVETGTILPPALTLRNSRSSAAGAGLVARLPAFPSASVEQILAVRTDLAGSLSRYRKAIRRLGEKLTYESFDAAIEFEIDEMWRDEVQPAIATLCEELQRHSFWKELTSEVAGDLPKMAAGGGALYLGISAATTLHDVATAILSAGVAATPVIRNALRNYRSETATTEGRGRKNELFFLYEADRRLT